MKNTYLEQRLEEWARWCHKGQIVNGIYYSPVAPGFSEYNKTDRAPTMADDRELEVERAVTTLNRLDKTAADVLRAEYRASPKFGDANVEDTGNNSNRTHRQLGISERTYRSKLEKAKTAIAVSILQNQLQTEDAL